MDFNEFVEKINDYLDEIEIELTDKQLMQFYNYMNLLIEWNRKINLTTIIEPEEIILKHFVDSIIISKYIGKGLKVIDVGTGAGFPGIPLKIIRDDLNVVLLDSLNKRINFLNEVIAKLKLEKIETIHNRIEEFGIKNREKYDIVVARAVAQLNILLEYCLPITKINGYFIAMKGNCLEEITNSKKALIKLSSHIEETNIFNLPIENSNRTIIKIKKDAITNKKFPRKYSEIKKYPL